jgi:hypothetical protein
VSWARLSSERPQWRVRLSALGCQWFNAVQSSSCPLHLVVAVTSHTQVSAINTEYFRSMSLQQMAQIAEVSPAGAAVDESRRDRHSGGLPVRDSGYIIGLVQEEGGSDATGSDTEATAG